MICCLNNKFDFFLGFLSVVPKKIDKVRKCSALSRYTFVVLCFLHGGYKGLRPYEDAIISLHLTYVSCM